MTLLSQVSATIALVLALGTFFLSSAAYFHQSEWNTSLAETLYNWAALAFIATLLSCLVFILSLIWRI